MIDPDDLSRAFEAAFGRPPRIYRTPGRVNLIGERTDYNDGFVLPMALDRSTWVAAAPRSDRQIVVRSREYNETATMDLDAPRGGPTGGWSDYVRGVASVLDDLSVEGARGCESSERRSPDLSAEASAKAERLALHQSERLALDSPERPALHSSERSALPGADMLIASDVPIGAGLSSSAALEMACGCALADLAGITLDLTTLARLGRREGVLSIAMTPRSARLLKAAS